VPSIASHFDVNAPVQEQGEAHADNLRLHGLQPDVRTFPDSATIPGFEIANPKPEAAPVTTAQTTEGPSPHFSVALFVMWSSS